MNLLNRFRKPFSHQNHRGVIYYLYKKDVTLRGGEEVTIYFFQKDPNYKNTNYGKPAYPVYKIPEGYRLMENPRNGFLTLARIYNEKLEEED